MCGIAGGVWWRDGLAIDQASLDSMRDAIAHRGPDDVGAYRSDRSHGPLGEIPGIALGFRRLSIIDLAGGHQPMTNEDDSIHVVFNGEIYNYLDLRRRLEGAGHRFRSRSDTESIVHLYEDVGTDCFSQFNGMFAIGIWDRRRGQLVLGRDRLGQKPLYYALHEGRLLFGSELKCFAAIPGVLGEIDPGAIDEYLTYQYIPHPNTIWKGVYKLPPGHFAVYRDQKLTVQRYWPFDPSLEVPCSESQAASELQSLLSDAVQKRLVADVPVGAFLSGGIDSSLIVALAQQHRLATGGEPIRTFSIGFPESDFDETHFAAEVAQFLGTKHQRFEVQPDAVGILDKLVWHYDEPFGDSSAIPTWYLSEWTRREVTVALSGDGGDELFGGYERYQALSLSRWLDGSGPLKRLFQARWIQRLPESKGRRSLIRKLKRFCEALGQPPVRRYMNWLQIFSERMRADLYREEFVSRLPGSDPVAFLEAAWDRAGNRDLISKASMADLQSYLPCDLNMKVDIASMAHGLEVRQPFLDYRVAEMAARLPVSLKVRGGRGKWLLQHAFEKKIPASIWKRSKMGFGVPIAKWFRGPLQPLVSQTLLAPDAQVAAMFRPDAVAQLVNEHLQGKRSHAYRLWNLLVLELWLRRWKT
jgi:asparagine synthase (glutamine-hydrolysing)